MARSSARKQEEGALLLILMVGAAVMSIGVAVAIQSWSATWRRDSEEELIFRGNQYVDAILAYKKEHNGQYPMNLEDLAKLGPRQLRYIRKLYRDPINPKGQWGLLYLMPGGAAIYDPVAAQRAKEGADADGKGGDAKDDTGGGGPQAGITQINFDPTGTGMMQPGMPGGLAGMAGAQGAGGMQAVNRNPAAGRGSFTGPGTQAGLGPAGGMTGMGGMGMGAAWTGGALPPPKPATGTFDEKSPSEPPIGWPIVGVISRVTGQRNDDTFKIWKGHEKVNEWQFHVFDRGMEMAQTPQGVVPGGSPSPFLGPGFGGQGSFGAIGGGPPGRPNNWGGGFGGGFGGGMGGGGGGMGGGAGRGGPAQRPGGPGTQPGGGSSN